MLNELEPFQIRDDLMNGDRSTWEARGETLVRRGIWPGIGTRSRLFGAGWRTRPSRGLGIFKISGIVGEEEFDFLSSVQTKKPHISISF